MERNFGMNVQDVKALDFPDSNLTNFRKKFDNYVSNFFDKRFNFEGEMKTYDQFLKIRSRFIWTLYKLLAFGSL